MTQERVSYSIPEAVREFLGIVDQIAGLMERGVWRFEDNPEGEFLWSEYTWTQHGQLFGPGFYGYSDDQLATFEFRHSVTANKSVFQATLTRNEIGRIARGDVTELELYRCTNTRCGFLSSDPFDYCTECGLEQGACLFECAHPLCNYHSPKPFERCPECRLERGKTIEHAGPDVLGICPRCRKTLRTLRARQCPHCLHDFHARR